LIILDDRLQWPEENSGFLYQRIFRGDFSAYDTLLHAGLATLLILIEEI